MATYRVMRWRDIPTQVKAEDETGAVVTQQLPLFFQQEVDRVAMREGLVGDDAYLDAWAWSEEAERAGTAAEVAAEVAAEIADDWKRSREEADA